MSSKITLSKKLRNILSHKSDYCCLCFNNINETEISYTINDEIALGVDITRTEMMNEVISEVLGVTVLDTIAENDAICRQCVEVIINSYKFIQQCRSNIEQLNSVAKSLLKHTQELSEVDCDFKSLFVAVDTCNSNVELYYDKYRSPCDITVLKKRFQRLQKDIPNLYIDFELQAHCSYDDKKTIINKRKKSIPLDDMLLNKDDQNNLKCKFCLKMFPTIIKIKQHYVNVHTPKQFKCTKCVRSFSTINLRNRHIKISHCDLYCSLCGKHFSNLHSLKYHEQSHVSHLSCKTCGKTYKHKKSYLQHIENKMCLKLRKSNAESRYECDYCGKKYAKKHDLAIHIRFAHENGKAFVCNMCSKTFYCMSKLQAHTLRHTKQKNHQCLECGKWFVTKTTLLLHTRMHTGDKPYKCEYCEMSFLSTSRRWQHVKQKHTGTDLECDICHRRYKGNMSLNRHRKLHFDIRSKLYQNTNHLK